MEKYHLRERVSNLIGILGISILFRIFAGNPTSKSLLSHDVCLELCQCDCTRCTNSNATGVYCFSEIFILHFVTDSRGSKDIIDVKKMRHI